VSDERDALEVELGLRPVGPMWIDAPPMGDLIGSHTPAVPGAGSHWIGGVERQGAAIVWRATSAAR
jgi:hypothetical protein